MYPNVIKTRILIVNITLTVGNAKFGFTEYINRLFIFLSLFSVNLDTAKIISEVLRVFVQGNRSYISWTFRIASSLLFMKPPPPPPPQNTHTHTQHSTYSTAQNMWCFVHPPTLAQGIPLQELLPAFLSKHCKWELEKNAQYKLIFSSIPVMISN